MDGDENVVPAATEDVGTTPKVKVPAEGEPTEQKKATVHFNTERSSKMKQTALEKSHMQLRIRELGVKAHQPSGALPFGGAGQDMSPLLVRRMKGDDQAPGPLDTPQSPTQTPGALRLPFHDMQRRQSHDRTYRVTALGIQAVGSKHSPDDQSPSEAPQSTIPSSPLGKTAKQNSVGHGELPVPPKAVSASPDWKKRLSENQFLSTPPTVRRYPQLAKDKKLKARTATKTDLLSGKSRKLERPGLHREKSPRPILSVTHSLPLKFSEERTVEKEGEEVEISVVPLSPGPKGEENRSTIPSLPPINQPVATNTAGLTTEVQPTVEIVYDDDINEDAIAIGQVANENVPTQDEDEEDPEPGPDLATRVETWINKLAFTAKSASFGDLRTGRKLDSQSQNSTFSRERSGSGTSLAERRASRLSSSSSQEGQPFIGLTLGTLTEGRITPQSPRPSFLSPTQRARFRFGTKSASCSSLAPSRDPRESIFSEGVAAPPEGSLDEEAPVGAIRALHFLHPSTCAQLKPSNVVDRIEATTGKTGVLAWLGLGTEDVHRIMRRASLIREEQERMRRFPILKTADGTPSE